MGRQPVASAGPVMLGAARVMPPVLVTRPAREAGQWVQHLQRAGLQAEALPLIDIAPAAGAADVVALQQAWQILSSYAACLFVSGNAVDYFFKQKFALPAALRFMAPGPGTKAALIAAGVSAGQIDAPPADAAQFDSEALWQLVGQRDWQGCRVLVVRGQSRGATGEGAASLGRDWIARQWQAAGASVDFVSVYERRAPLLTAAQLGRAQAASADGSVWLFSSSEAVAYLMALPGLQAMDWHRARAITTHPRIAGTVRAAGWGVVVESRPALKDILDSLRSIELTYP